jgi:hypothetical protein
MDNECQLIRVVHEQFIERKLTFRRDPERKEISGMRKPKGLIAEPTGRVVLLLRNGKYAVAGCVCFQLIYRIDLYCKQTLNHAEKRFITQSVIKTSVSRALNLKPFLLYTLTILIL